MMRVVIDPSGELDRENSTNFVSILKLMIKLLAITDVLSHVLQKKDLNIVHDAMELVSHMKNRLASLRESVWDDLFLEVHFFGMEKGIPVLNMDDRIPVSGHSKLHMG
jgi:hypothetical protein